MNHQTNLSPSLSHGAWLSFGNVDLHLIKGRPAVHLDDDLIVSHIALTVGDMDGLRKRLENLGVVSRKNISVPNPELKTAVDQVRRGSFGDGWHLIGLFEG